MGGCSAVNCANHSRKKFRLFKFPREPERRKKWIVNCRRQSWEPGPSAELCEVHFEDSQFESHRADGWRKLKPNAIPTLFDVPNPPKELMSRRQKGIGLPKPGSLLDPGPSIELEPLPEVESDNVLIQRIAALEEQNCLLRKQLKEKDSALSSFLSAEQVAVLGKEKKSIAHWSDESVVKGLKLRFVLGKQGYEYLSSTGYPTPSYSTLNRRTQGISLEYGVLNNLLTLLSTKVESMEESDRNCCLLIDEMEISSLKDFDKSTMSFVGGVTLGEQQAVGKHYTVVLLRGLKSHWKQVIAHEVTGPSTSGSSMKNLVLNTVQAVSSVGLKVKAVVSDMGSNNKAMWSAFGICVSRSERNIRCSVGVMGESICFVADVPHILKNLRSAFLARILILPDDVHVGQELPTKFVSSGHIKSLWISELNSESSLRSLHHLNKSHLFPTHFTRMNVATAVQLFSPKTAAALEKGVALKQVSKDALTTAWFVRFIHEWFELMTARHPKKGITIRNKDKKISFLRNVVNIVENMQLGKGWKPVQTGMIMSTLSVISLMEECFAEGYSFFLPGRVTQDALENVFAQVRRKSGAKPTALQAKRALKLVCISQFISDVRHTNYASDSDLHLLDLSRSAGCGLVTSSLTPLSEEEDADDPQPSQAKPLTVSEENDIVFIAGATLNAVLKQKLCVICIEALQTAVDSNEPVVPHYRKLLTEYCNRGGLHQPSSGLYRICREAERLLQKFKGEIVDTEKSMNASFIEDIKERCGNVVLPSCCRLFERVVRHYLIVRAKGIQTHMMNKKAYEASFSSASLSKKQKKQ